MFSATTLTEEHRRVLTAMYLALKEAGDWPQSRRFNAEMRKISLRVEDVPSEYFSNFRPDMEDARVHLTARGLSVIEEASTDCAALVDIIKFLARKHLADPDAGDVAASEVADALQFDKATPFRRLLKLAQGLSPLLFVGGNTSSADLSGYRFSISPRVLDYADITNFDDAIRISATPWRSSNGLDLYAPVGPTAWLLETAKHITWLDTKTFTTHLQKADNHRVAVPPSWDDSSAQMRKAIELLVRDFAVREAGKRTAKIPAYQSRPTAAEYLDYLKGVGVLDRNERSFFVALYGWLSDKGAHPGIPLPIEGEVKHEIAERVLRLLLAKAINP